MKPLIFILVLVSVCTMKSYSQTDSTKGVAFEHSLTWEEILQKAQRENKDIFVDCYATWCSPCKWMDRDVYPIDSVGAFVNERFISVRLQMDTTQKDNDVTRQWYSTAHEMHSKYNIVGYPSFLFFSSDGRVLHKDMGFKDSEPFLAMARAAMDAKQQYYTLLTNYRNQNMACDLMPTLTDAAARVHQDSIVRQVSRDYIHRCVETLPEDQLWTVKKNILFLRRYSNNVMISDKIFQLFDKDIATIDSTMHDPHFSDGFIDEILYRDVVKLRVDQALAANIEPNWRRLEKAITKDYGCDHAKKNVLQGKIDYNRSKKDWNKYIKYFIKQEEIKGIDTARTGPVCAELNNSAFEIFEYSKNRRYLEKALFWVNASISMLPQPFPEELDTKANLLYKLGRRSEGLSLEEKSHAMAPGDRTIATNYEKMKTGQPTWVVQ
jgi:thioredoxin-related protein